MNSQSALQQAIAQQIANSPEKRISFAEYMDLVLYHPEHGYYSSNAVKIGFKGGDFFTSVNLGADFGDLLAEQFVQMWEVLRQPVPFYLVEMGAGQGLLALYILNYIQLKYPHLFAVLKYVIIEKSPSLKEEQQQRLKGLPVSWCNWEEISPESIIGCFFSNELVDALPVHQFTLEAGELKEIYVTIQGNNYQEVIAEPSTPKLREYFDLVGINLSQGGYLDGYRSEINLAALDWLSIVADRLQRGYVITIDYGYPASRYYNPRRSQGTLQCYYQHRHHDNPYINIGRQDITAHVDFTALERWGDRCGLEKLGFTQQALFLMSLGLGDRIAALSSQEIPIAELLNRRQALHQLIDPSGLGGFGVLIQAKGLTQDEATQPLKGLTVPTK